MTQSDVLNLLVRNMSFLNQSTLSSTLEECGLSVCDNGWDAALTKSRPSRVVL